MSPSQRIPPLPTVLHLVQTVALGRWRATSEDLYREVARLLGAEPGRDLLVSGCGEGATTEWLAARTGAAVTGIDPSPVSIERAEERARRLRVAVPVSYQQGALDDLPLETAVFDGAVGEPVLASAQSCERAVAELARVTRPMGAVVLLQLTWSSDVSAATRDMIAERLGLRPQLVIEWKQMMRDAGLVEIQVQDWTADASRPPAAPRAAPALTWGQKAHIVGRAWRRWGWREARGAIQRETTFLRELARERAIGFQLLSGVKWPHASGAAT